MNNNSRRWKQGIEICLRQKEKSILRTIGYRWNDWKARNDRHGILRFHHQSRRIFVRIYNPTGERRARLRSCLGNLSGPFWKKNLLVSLRIKQNGGLLLPYVKMASMYRYVYLYYYLIFRINSCRGHFQPRIWQSYSEFTKTRGLVYSVYIPLADILSSPLILLLLQAARYLFKKKKLLCIADERIENVLFSFSFCFHHFFSLYQTWKRTYLYRDIHVLYFYPLCVSLTFSRSRSFASYQISYIRQAFCI